MKKLCREPTIRAPCVAFHSSKWNGEETFQLSFPTCHSPQPTPYWAHLTHPHNQWTINAIEQTLQKLDISLNVLNLCYLMQPDIVNLILCTSWHLGGFGFLFASCKLSMWTWM